MIWIFLLIGCCLSCSTSRPEVSLTPPVSHTLNPQYSTITPSPPLQKHYTPCSRPLSSQTAHLIYTTIRKEDQVPQFLSPQIDWTIQQALVIILPKTTYMTRWWIHPTLKDHQRPHSISQFKKNMPSLCTYSFQKTLQKHHQNEMVEHWTQSSTMTQKNTHNRIEISHTLYNNGPIVIMVHPTLFHKAQLKFANGFPSIFPYRLSVKQQAIFLKKFSIDTISLQAEWGIAQLDSLPARVDTNYVNRLKLSKSSPLMPYWYRPPAFLEWSYSFD